MSKPMMGSDWIKDEQQVKDMEVGKVAFVPLSAVKIDIHRHAWIDPAATRIDAREVGAGQGFEYRPNVAGPRPGDLALVERLDAGFKLDLTYINDYPKWTLGAIPDASRDGGLPWFPVLEIVEQE